MIYNYKNFRIICPTDKELKRFDDRIFVKGVGKIADKIPNIMETISILLGIEDYSHMKFDIILMQDKEEVSAKYKELYNLTVEYVAFYAPSDTKIYLALDYVNKPILAHELAHMFVDKYFVVGVTRKIHEIIAMYVERHI